MARTHWTVKKWSGVAFTDDGYIYAPNENLSIEKTSTLGKTQLLDGSYGYYSPEVKFNNGPLTLHFLELDDDDTVIGKLEDYVENQDLLQITDHIGDTREGIFTSFKRIWLTGIEGTYDIEVVFEVMG